MQQMIICTSYLFESKSIILSSSFFYFKITNSEIAEYTTTGANPPCHAEIATNIVPIDK